MKILLIEESDTISVTIPIVLRKHGVQPNNIRWCRAPSHALPILEKETFDGIICTSRFYQGEYGPRFLSEMYLSGLIRPGSVILLFYENKKDIHQWLIPPLCHAMVLERPFNTKSLEECIEELCQWLNRASDLSHLIEQQSLNEAIYLVEDLQFVSPKWQESLDQIKGQLLMIKQEYTWALQHFQQCCFDYKTRWVYTGMVNAYLWMDQGQNASKCIDSIDKNEHPVSYYEALFAIDLNLNRYKECHKHVDKLLSFIPWQHTWHEWGTLLQILMQNYTEALKYATEDHSHQLRRASIRQHLKRFQLHAILVMSSAFPNQQNRRRLFQEWKEIEQALAHVVSPQEQLLFQAQTHCLNMHFEAAREVLNGLESVPSNLPLHTLLYGWSICWLTALPKHAQEFCHAMNAKQDEDHRDFIHYALIKALKVHMQRRTKQRSEHLKELHIRRNAAITEKNYPSALKYSIDLFHYYPAFPGDALICIELLAVAWPPAMTAKDVEALLNQLCTIVTHGPKLDEPHFERYKKAQRKARRKIHHRHLHP